MKLFEQKGFVPMKLYVIVYIINRKKIKMRIKIDRIKFSDLFDE